MVSIAQVRRPAARIRPKLNRDDWLMRAFMVAIALYLIVALALPLYAMLSKSFEIYSFRLDTIEFQVDEGQGWGPPINALERGEELGIVRRDDLVTTADGRMQATEFFPDFSFLAPTRYRIRNTEPNTGGYMVRGQQFTDTEWREFSSNDFRRVTLRPSQTKGIGNYLVYFSTPALFSSIEHSLTISIISTIITVSLAFVFAYALTRSCMPFKGLFKTAALVPILVPSLLPGIALVYLFGSQSIVVKVLEALFGADSVAWVWQALDNGTYGPTEIYGPIGIVIASVFFTFPHALLIIITALSIADARLYEAAIALRAPKWRIFWTVTLPGARYGLISAAFVVFNLVITDFGAPKVIGGQYNVLAVDIYKQVIGQQNFQMGAVVSVVLLIPALVAFTVDRLVQKRQVALLSARAVPYQPRPMRRFDLLMMGYTGIVSLFILGILAVCQFAALIKFWPYDLSFSLNNYNFDVMDGGGWDSYGNSIRMALYTAVIGTSVVFFGAYLVEKGRGFAAGRTAFQFLAMMPMAIPGMVLGLSYIFFFNDPANPLNFIYGTMAILVICTVTHFYTVSHLTAVTALKQMDAEFELVSQSLKQPFTKIFARVTIPVCMPAILDISIYLFVNAMTTVSAVVFLYSPDTTLASVAVLNMDDAGDVAPAAAMGMMIFYTNALMRGLHALGTRGLMARTQAWRTR
ncbi:MAG: putative 2-aminoethylphosphonate ABC transporter permease subunit [Alphaproteobacteria bacterium]|nr:MAG: putative 2-aminoethylphosphonate ABC transporter permease subunit [Alphaproteobacteria bacterium]